MRCHYCNREREVHLFYYDFFKVIYDDTKWAYLCDECRTKYLKFSNYAHRDRTDLIEMQKEIEENITISRMIEEDEKKLLTMDEYKKHSISSNNDFEKVYKNIEKLSIIVIRKNNIPPEKQDEYKIYLINELLGLLNSKTNDNDNINLLKINIVLDTKLKNLVMNDSLMSEKNINYEQIDHLLRKSNKSEETEFNADNELEKFATSIMKITVPSVENNYLNKEQIERLKSSILSLEDFEREFIFLRFGFFNNPMSLDKMQKEYYEGLTINQLIFIENELLNQIKNNLEKNITRKRKL